MIDTNSKLPIYYQLALAFENKIATGLWKKGSIIPSERELCKIYQVSRITVRNAVEELVKQGKLEKIQGKGTYVVGKSIVQNLGNVYSFSKEMEKQGKITTTRLLKLNLIKINEQLAIQLGVNEGDDVVYVERLRCADSQPVMLEKTYFPRHYDFVLDLDLNTVQLYKTLEEDFGLKINKAIETFKACQLNDDECGILECADNPYGLLIKRTSYSGDQLVCYSTIVAKGDIFEFTIKLVS